MKFFLHEFSGEVIHGQKRGKKLGFPTANIALTKHIDPGVYFSNTMLDKTLYTSLCFIGNATTFDEKTYQAEVYILDFDEDIYGELLHAQLLEKYREPVKFLSSQDLVEKMKNDEKEARAYFSLQ